MIATQGNLDVSYAMVHPDELARLKAVDVAAREWAETVGAVEDWEEFHFYEDYPNGMLRRSMDAYTALRALFAPESPV